MEERNLRKTRTGKVVSNKMDKTIFENYIKVGKKADSISTLLKFLRR